MEEEKSQLDINQEAWEDGANWRWGIFYFGERDSRVWVPKRRLMGRNRSGGTFNLAKPAARRFLWSFVTLLLGALVLAALADRG